MDEPPTGDVSGEFLREFRAAVAEGRRPAPGVTIRVAAGAASRARLISLLEAESVERRFRDTLIDLFEETAEDLEEQIDKADAIIELVDRAAMPVAIAAFLSGVGLFVSAGWGRGSTALLFAGLLSLTAGSVARTLLRLRENAYKAQVKRLRRLGARLKDI